MPESKVAFTKNKTQQCKQAVNIVKLSPADFGILVFWKTKFSSSMMRLFKWKHIVYCIRFIRKVGRCCTRRNRVEKQLLESSTQVILLKSRICFVTLEFISLVHSMYMFECTVFIFCSLKTAIDVFIVDIDE